MGQEARCRAWIDGVETEGRAHLDTDELVFRGQPRLKVRLNEVTAVEDAEGRLTLAHSGGTAVFELGSAAARWAEKIRNPRTLLDKLGLGVTSRVVVLDLADPDFLAQVRARAAVVAVDTSAGYGPAPLPDGGGMTSADQPICIDAPGQGGPADVILLGINDLDDLRRLAALRERIVPNGAIWVVHPKGRRDLRDIDVMAAGKQAGLVDTKVSRFSDTHSALRFVIPRDRR